MNIVFHAKKEKGKELYIFNRANYDKYIESLEGDLELIIRKRKNIRSLQQNAYLWGVVYQIISEETGHTINELHQYFKILFLSKEITVKGNTQRIVGRSSLLKVSDFSVFLERIIQWCSENEIIIPDAKSVEI